MRCDRPPQIPVFVARDQADAFQRREVFRLGQFAGRQIGLAQVLMRAAVTRIECRRDLKMRNRQFQQSDAAKAYPMKSWMSALRGSRNAASFNASIAEAHCPAFRHPLVRNTWISRSRIFFRKVLRLSPSRSAARI